MPEETIEEQARQYLRNLPPYVAERVGPRLLEALLDENERLNKHKEHREFCILKLADKAGIDVSENSWKSANNVLQDKMEGYQDLQAENERLRIDNEGYADGFDIQNVEMLRLRKILRLAVVLIESIRQHVGFPGFIDIAGDSELTHLGYAGWIAEIRLLLGDFEVQDGEFVEKGAGDGSETI